MDVQYLFGTHTVGAEERGLLRTKSSEPLTLAEGIFHNVEENSDFMTITHDFKVGALLKRSTDSEGNHYAWYDLAEHFRVVDRSPEALLLAQANRDVTSIAFVTLAESGSIDDVTAGEHVDLFIEWSGLGIQYEVGQLRKYEGKLYRCVQAHKSQPDWTPETAVSLWAKASDPAEEWPEWSQPQGAHDAYPLGAKVTYKGKHYVNDIEANIYPPDTMNGGWHEAREGE